MNLYNFYSWNEVKLMIITGVVIYGMCQYDHVSLAWSFLFLPVIYLMLSNLFSYVYISLAHQNAPKDSEQSDLLSKFKSNGIEEGGANVYPETPTVKKEVNTNIFGIRGDPSGEKNSDPPIPPTPPIEHSQSSISPPQQSTQLSALDQQFSGDLTGSWGSF